MRLQLILDVDYKLDVGIQAIKDNLESIVQKAVVPHLAEAEVVKWRMIVNEPDLMLKELNVENQLVRQFNFVRGMAMRLMTQEWNDRASALSNKRIMAESAMEGANALWAELCKQFGAESLSFNQINKVGHEG